MGFLFVFFATLHFSHADIPPSSFGGPHTPEELEYFRKTSARIACERSATPAACGAVGEMRSWKLRGLGSLNQRSIKGQTLDGVFRQIGLPDTEESGKKVAEFLKKADSVILDHQKKLEAVFDQRLVIQSSPTIVSKPKMLESGTAEFAIETSLRTELAALQTKIFGKLPPQVVMNHPADVYASHALAEIRHSYEKKGMEIPTAHRAIPSYIKSQKTLYSNLQKAARAGIKNLDGLGKMAGTAGLTVLSVATQAATTLYQSKLVVECSKKLGIVLNDEDTFQLSRYALSYGQGAKDQINGCEQLSFEPGTIETLSEAKKITPNVKAFLLKYATVLKERQDAIFSLKNLEFSCSGYSWENTRVIVEDSQIRVIAKVSDKKTLETNLAWNTVNEWDYMTIGSSDPDYRQYLNDKVRSLTPTSNFGRSSQKLQMSPQVSCRESQIGIYDKARCETARAISLWNQFSSTQKENCTRKELPSAAPGENSNSKAVPAKM